MFHFWLIIYAYICTCRERNLKKASPQSLITWSVQIFFTWRHGGHIGRPKERNGGHFDGTKQPLNNWIPFLCRFYLLLFKINMVAGHVSANHLLETICAYIQKSNLVAKAFLRRGEGEPTVSPPSPRWRKALGTRLTKEIYRLTPIDDCFFYPVSVFWQDVAGSGVVHALGGTVALIGAYTVGPRLGKFGDDGKPRMLQGHTVPVSTP